LTSDGALTDVI